VVQEEDTAHEVNSVRCADNEVVAVVVDNGSLQSCQNTAEGDTGVHDEDAGAEVDSPKIPMPHTTDNGAAGEAFPDSYERRSDLPVPRHACPLEPLRRLHRRHRLHFLFSLSF
jgi:hypothetical protein